MKLIEWIKSKFKEEEIKPIAPRSGISLIDASTGEVVWEAKGNDAEEITTIICDDKSWKKFWIDNEHTKR